MLDLKYEIDLLETTIIYGNAISTFQLITVLLTQLPAIPSLVKDRVQPIKGIYMALFGLGFVFLNVSMLRYPNLSCWSTSSWPITWWLHNHYNDIIMSEMPSQIISVSIVCSTIFAGADQRKHQSSAAPLAFVRGIHWWPVNSPHKRPVTRKIFPFDGIIMIKEVYLTLNVYIESNHSKTSKHKLCLKLLGCTVCCCFHKWFLAATKQLYEWYFLSVCPSVRLSVCLSVCPSVRLSVCHTFLTMFPSSYHHEIFRSYHIGPG